MATDSPRPFKVIISGGSIAGLMLANALERANIDFEVLEKREVAPQLGQSILNLPCTNLVFEQIGIDAAINEVAVPIDMREHWENGEKLFCASEELILLRKHQGRPVHFIDRYSHLKALYGGLSEASKAKVRAHEGVESFIEHENGVTVRTDKGNVVEGSIIVGADGVHSWVRQLMAQHLKESNPVASASFAGGFKTRYRCLTCTSHNRWAKDPTRKILKDGSINNSYYPEFGIGGLSVAGTKDKIFWAIYIPCDKEYDYPSPKWGQADIDEAIKKYGHLQVTPEYTFNDLWDSLTGVNMLSMEEGAIATKWHSGGRAVLMGDAAHKGTANLGMGGNLAVDDACCLANNLHALLQRTKEPTTAEIVQTFDSYDRSERPRAVFVKTASGMFCDFETMSKWYSPIIRFIFPWVPMWLRVWVFSGFDGSAPRLDFMPLPGQ